MESKYFKVGALVDIVGTTSTRADTKRKVLEVHPQGIVVQATHSKDAPVHFFSWEKIVELRLSQDAAVVGIKTTAGGKAS
jgi:hypothetical protein